MNVWVDHYIKVRTAVGLRDLAQFAFRRGWFGLNLRLHGWADGIDVTVPS